MNADGYGHTCMKSSGNGCPLLHSTLNIATNAKPSDMCGCKATGHVVKTTTQRFLMLFLSKMTINICIPTYRKVEQDNEKHYTVNDGLRIAPFPSVYLAQAKHSIIAHLPICCLLPLPSFNCSRVKAVWGQIALKQAGKNTLFESVPVFNSPNRTVKGKSISG